MKIRLQIGVAVVFTVLTTALLGIVVTFLYTGNRNLALKTAQEEMEQARAWSVWNMRATIQRTEQTVSSIASFVGEFPDASQSLGGLNTLNALARGNDHFYGLYFGFEADGAFYQNIILPRDTQVFGPDDQPVPETATRVLRVINGTGADRRETFFWSDDGDQAQSFLERAPSYDPRERPWYMGALETDGLYVTEPYLFESTGRLGVTFARRITDPAGALIGVAGIDMTMSALSRILEEMRIGEHGIVFMLNDNGQLMSYTGTRADGQGARFLATDPELRLQTTSESVRQAISHWSEKETSFFHFQPSAEAATQIASVAPVTAIFGEEYTLGLAVPEDEFVGAINQNTARALQISAIVLIMAVALTAIIARLLSASLREVTEEANRISNFELADRLDLNTKLQEVSELGTAMSSMKAGLASFGAYVPKDLVRSIVSRGEMPNVGGTSKDVTLLFSDLQGFTGRTEGLAPEQLMPALSKYFEVMETQIARNQGNVDKYIGDAIMAMWNAPLDDPQHVEHACRSALACLHAEARLNDDPDLAPLAPLLTRFGLHTGQVIVGNVGSLSRMQYTALGAVVNLASRIEGLNKAYGTRILVSDAVADQISDAFVLREIDVVFPAGTSQPTTLFELVGEQDENSAFAASDRRRTEVASWTKCYDLYRAGAWADALKALDAFRSEAINVALVDTYIQRCRGFVETPPPPDWDGVYTFTKK